MSEGLNQAVLLDVLRPVRNEDGTVKGEEVADGAKTGVVDNTQNTDGVLEG